MTVILQQPSSVLVVSRTGETGPQVRTALAGASDTTVRHEPDTDGALAALDDGRRLAGNRLDAPSSGHQMGLSVSSSGS